MKRLDLASHLFLFSAFFIGAIAVVRLKYDPIAQFLVILLLALFYTLWGAVYHHLRGDISKKVLLEYILIAAIVTIAGFLVFVR